MYFLKKERKKRNIEWKWGGEEWKFGEKNKENGRMLEVDEKDRKIKFVGKRSKI